MSKQVKKIRGIGTTPVLHLRISVNDQNGVTSVVEIQRITLADEVIIRKEELRQSEISHREGVVL